MNSFRIKFSAYAVALVMALSLAGVGAAQNRNDRDIRDAVRSLNSKIEDFETNLRYQMQSTSAASTDLSAVTDDIRGLRNTVSQFEDYFERKRENRDDVRAIIQAARRVDDFLDRSPQNRRVEEDWAAAKKQIDRIAANYGVKPDWNRRGVTAANPNVDYSTTTSPVRTSNVGLSGTYDIDATRSENVDEIVADSQAPNDRRNELKDRLSAPEQIALDVRGNQVTLATTNAAPVSFIADGREKTEQGPDGRTMRLKATLAGEKLTVTTLGGDNDYTITFTSMDGGKTLKVQRRITTEYLKQTVFAESLYNKSDSVAKLGIKVDDTAGTYSDNDAPTTITNGGTGVQTGRPAAVTAKPGNYTVPNGVSVIAILENEVNTKVSQNNDRFKMTVQSPDEFRGATIEGYVTGLARSGTVTGDPKITFNFEKITLRTGETYDFAATLQNVQPINGKSVSVDNEGTIRGESQTKQTAKRGGIGAGLGAIIGAIAGGAKGAAIGAVIGAGGGAGTVALQGKGDIQLQTGTTVTVISSSPISR